MLSHPHDSVDFGIGRDCPVVGVVLEIEADVGVEEAQDGARVPAVVASRVHVVLQVERHGQDEEHLEFKKTFFDFLLTWINLVFQFLTCLQVVGPWRKGISPGQNFLNSPAQLQEVLVQFRIFLWSVRIDSEKCEGDSLVWELLAVVGDEGLYDQETEIHEILEVIL